MGIKVGREHGLCVHDNLASSGQLHDHIRPETPIVALHRELLGEIAVVYHTREFSYPLQRQLAPLASYGRSPQGFHQVARLLLQSVLRFC